MRMRTLLLCCAIGAGACATVSAPARSQGEVLHGAKCGACHLRPQPSRFDAKGWEQVLDRHHTRVPLTDEQRRQLLHYLEGRDPETAGSEHPTTGGRGPDA